MNLIVKKIKNKLLKESFRLLLPKNRYLKYAWNNEDVSASWYEVVRKNPLRDLSREEYREFINTVGIVLESSNSLGIDLGCGDFRITEHFLKLFPTSDYAGIDFSSHAENAYCQKHEQNSKISYIKADITDVDCWLPFIQEKYPDFKKVIFTYGVLTYLSGAELSALLVKLKNIPELLSVVSIEPTGKENLDLILSKKGGDSFYHNYSFYFTGAGFKLNKYNYLFNKEYIFIVAEGK